MNENWKEQALAWRRIATELYSLTVDKDDQPDKWQKAADDYLVMDAIHTPLEESHYAHLGSDEVEYGREEECAA